MVSGISGRDRGAPPVVLIVEDDPAIRATLRVFFQSRGFSVRTASDGIEAEMEIRESRIALALVDARISGIPGQQVARQLRRLSPSTKVILFSRREGENPGAEDDGIWVLKEAPPFFPGFWSLIETVATGFSWKDGEKSRPAGPGTAG